MGGAVTKLCGLNAVAGVHQLPLVDFNVESTAGWVRTGLDADGDGVHGTGDVGGGEVVSDRRAADITVAGTALTGLTVSPGRVAFNGGDGHHEEDHQNDGKQTGWGVHSLRIVTLHIIKLVFRPYIALQKVGQNHRGAIK